MRAHIANLQSVRSLVGLSLLGAALLTTPAFATGGVSCASKDGNADIAIGLGRLPIYAPLNAYARYGERVWSSSPEPGDMEMGETQGLIEEDSFSADFADDNIENIIISLRIDLTSDESDEGYPGTLTFEDGIVHQVFCEFE